MRSSGGQPGGFEAAPKASASMSLVRLVPKPLDESKHRGRNGGRLARLVFGPWRGLRNGVNLPVAVPVRLIILPMMARIRFGHCIK
jgi:hypothetical protein